MPRGDMSKEDLDDLLEYLKLLVMKRRTEKR